MLQEINGTKIKVDKKRGISMEKFWKKSRYSLNPLMFKRGFQADSVGSIPIIRSNVGA